MNKQQLAAKIWESANQMRSKIDANEYKDYILGFIFYKYICEKELQFLRGEEFSEEDIQTLSEENIDEKTLNYITENNGYFIAYENLFSTWINMGNDFNVSNVRDALSAFSRLISREHKNVYEGIFETLHTGLSKLGESTASQTKAISNLLQLIKDIPMNGKQDYDVLGFIYEYLISMFAANAGKKAGEFYTPHEVSLLMSEIVADHLKNRDEIQIYDPTSGSGSLLINIGNSVAKHINGKDNIKYYAQELKKNTYNLTRMNLVMRGILPNNIVTRNGDTLEEDWPYFDDNNKIALYVDAVVSNPPYSQQWEPDHKEDDPRYKPFGMAPKTKADYAFLLHDLFHLRPDGIMTIVLPHGVLFRGGEEGVIRKNLIEGNHIDAIIGLPANIFFGTGIPTTILVLKQKRENTDVLIVDASKGFIKIGKSNQLRASDIKRITDTVINRDTNEKYSKVVSRNVIRINEYNLNIPRYVDSSEDNISWDIYATMNGGIPEKEIDDLEIYWQAFPQLRNTLFAKRSTPYYDLIVKDVNHSITEHANVKTFVMVFSKAFADFYNFLRSELIRTNIEMMSIAKEQIILGNNIFERLKDIPLIDKYEAYQLFDDEWTKIEGDLEIIKTETFEAIKIVDPNMVFKKIKGKEQEVQEGWIGRVMPFDLVQNTYLHTELQQVNKKQNRIVEITVSFSEILDSLSEEEKEADIVNEVKDGFVNAKIKRQAKKLKAEAKKNGAFAIDCLESKIIKIDTLITEDRELKKQVKSEMAKLHLLTKDTIENLDDTQANELLELKWITPLVSSINRLPEVLIRELTTKVKSLSVKYATTYSEITEDIGTTEKQLASIIDELTGEEFDMEGITAFKSLLNG